MKVLQAIAFFTFIFHVAFTATLLFVKVSSKSPSVGRLRGGYISKDSLSMPIYYTNLARSKARRAHMERTFAHWGRLIRFPALDINDEAAVHAAVDTHGLSAFDYFVEKGRATGPGAGALLASKALAAKKAYDEGEERILLLEDDTSDMLVPFWRYSLDEIVELADQHQPGWYFIQLQVATKTDVYKSWKLDPKNPFVDRTRLQNAHPWGCGAVLLSREGMKMLIDRLFVGSDGKFDCLPEVHKSLEVRCHPDNFLWRMEEQSKILLAMPPLFTMIVNEGSTGIRRMERVEQDTTGSDKETVHFQAALFAMRESLLALAEHNFQRDFEVDKTAKEADMWYMKDLSGLDLFLKDVVVNP